MDDLISRQAAIDIVLGACKDVAATECAVRELEELPSAQPEHRWIPCSERLPDKPNVYTVTDHDGRVVRYAYYDNESSREYWKRCAKAWMPLPEPYKEGQE